MEVPTDSNHDLDKILTEIGQFGVFQILSCALISLPMLFCGIELSFAFAASGVEQRCLINECDLDGARNISFLPPWINNSVPFENGAPAKCTRYRPYNSSETLDIKNRSSISSSNGFCSAEMFDQRTTESCSEFVYKTEERTIATEWDMSCPNDAWKLALIGTIHNVGQFIGMPIGGYISDRYGRRTILALAGTISALMGIIRSFSVNYIMFAVFEMLNAFGGIVYPTVIVLGMELVGPEKRALSTAILAAAYPLGEVTMGLVAKYVTNWRNFLRFLYAPGLLHIAYFWIIDESVRWLLAKGRYDEAIRTLKKAARFNRTQLSEQSLEKLCLNSESHKESSEDASSESYPICHACTSPKLLFRIVNLSFCWFTNVLVYYGLSLNSVSFAGDKYVNFMLVCLVEIPGAIASYFAVSLLGRRPSQSGFLIISGLACLLSYFVSENQPWLAFSLVLLGKLAITASFVVLFVYASELFPTNLRQSLISFCIMFGRIGSMIAPQTPLLAEILPALPLILFGSCAIISGVLVLTFPETANTTLPTTILDAENVGNNAVKNEVNGNAQ